MQHLLHLGCANSCASGWECSREQTGKAQPSVHNPGVKALGLRKGWNMGKELGSELSIVRRAALKWEFTMESHMHPTSVADLNTSAVFLGLFPCFLLVQERGSPPAEKINSQRALVFLNLENSSL